MNQGDKLGKDIFLKYTKKLNKNHLLPLLGMGIFLYLICYFRMTEFGLYEEDFYYTVLGINQNSLAEMRGAIYTHLAPGTGLRILFEPISILLVSGSLYFFHHLWSLYVIGFIILLSCGFFFYLFIYEIWRIRFLAFLAAILFFSWPSDTTKNLLCILMPNLALLFFWMFGLLYAKDKKISALLCLIISLLIYEVGILLCFCVLLLIFYKRRGRNLSKNIFFELFRFLEPCAFLISCYLFLRFSIKDHRLNHALSLFGESVFFRVYNSMKVGAFHSVMAPFNFRNFSLSQEDMLLAGVAGIFVWFIVLSFSKNSERDSDGIQNLKLVEAFCFGLFFLLAAYIVYAFVPERYPPSAGIGRITEVHKSSSFGLSIGLAAVLVYMWDLGRKYELFFRHGIIIALFFALARFSIDVQNDYSKAWILTKSRWQQTFSLSSPLREGKIVLVQGEGRETFHILNNSWNEIFLFRDFFVLPDEWKDQPKYIFPWRILGPMEYEMIPKSNLVRLYSSTNFLDINGDLFAGFNYKETFVARENLLVLRMTKDGLLTKVLEPPMGIGGGANGSVPIESLKKQRLYSLVFD